MSHIHFIGGEKGGVGKSVVARVLAQYFIDKEIPFVGFDSDRSHGSLTRFYSGFASPVVLEDYESLDKIVEVATEQPGTRVLVDLAAQTHGALTRWIDESGVLELLGELEVPVTYWHVMDSGKDSADLLAKLFERFGPRLHYVVVLNEARGDNFQILNNSGTKQRAFELGSRFLSLRKLNETVINKIDAANTSFWAAKTKPEGDVKGLGILERQRVKVWLGHAYEQIDSLGV